MLKRILAVLIVSVAVTGGAVAGPFEDGTAAAQRGDYAKALTLLLPLAEQGDNRARVALGDMYMHWGDLQDEAEAVKWYRLAAEQGNAVAQFDVGTIYATGIGEPEVPRDYVQGHLWLDLAAAQGDAAGLSAEQRKLVVKNRDLVAKLMTPDQLAEAQRLAREWKPKTQP
jgi:TPR repeat protein